MFQSVTGLPQLLGGTDPDCARIVRNMLEAHGRVGDFRTLVVIKAFGGDESPRANQAFNKRS